LKSLRLVFTCIYCRTATEKTIQITSHADKYVKPGPFLAKLTPLGQHIIRFRSHRVPVVSKYNIISEFAISSVNPFSEISFHSNRFHGYLHAEFTNMPSDKKWSYFMPEDRPSLIPKEILPQKQEFPEWVV